MHIKTGRKLIIPKDNIFYLHLLNKTNIGIYSNVTNIVVKSNDLFLKHFMYMSYNLGSEPSKYIYLKYCVKKLDLATSFQCYSWRIYSLSSTEVYHVVFKM